MCDRHRRKSGFAAQPIDPCGLAKGIARESEGAVAMRSSLDKDTVLRYTKAEWDAFVLGARDGEFDLR